MIKFRYPRELPPPFYVLYPWGDWAGRLNILYCHMHYIWGFQQPPFKRNRQPVNEVLS